MKQIIFMAVFAFGYNAQAVLTKKQLAEERPAEAADGTLWHSSRAAETDWHAGRAIGTAWNASRAAEAVAKAAVDVRDIWIAQANAETITEADAKKATEAMDTFRQAVRTAQLAYADAAWHATRFVDTSIIAVRTFPTPEEKSGSE